MQNGPAKARVKSRTFTPASGNAEVQDDDGVNSVMCSNGKLANSELSLEDHDLLEYYEIPWGDITAMYDALLPREMDLPHCRNDVLSDYIFHQKHRTSDDGDESLFNTGKLENSRAVHS